MYIYLYFYYNLYAIFFLSQTSKRITTKICSSVFWEEKSLSFFQNEKIRNFSRKLIKINLK